MNDLNDTEPIDTHLKTKAVATANQAIREALENINSDETHQKPAAAFCELIAAHALIQVFDRHAITFSAQFERLLEIAERGVNALEEMAESADWLASHPDGKGDDVNLEEWLARRKVYETLKAAFVRDNPKASQQEYTRVMRQYERLLGL